MKFEFHRAGKLVGIFITCLSFLYLARLLWINGKYIIGYAGIRRLIVFVVPAGFVYGLVCVLLAVAWHYLVKALDCSARLSATYPIYVRSQIAKYLPGNIFHYAGRQILGKAAGFDHKVTLTATAYETLLLISAALSLALMGFSLFDVDPYYERVLLIAGILVTLGIFISSYLLPRIPFLRDYLVGIADFDLKDWFNFLLAPFLAYVFFFLFIGVLICIITCLSFRFEFSVRQVFSFCSVYATSWVLGFITPGSPGGIGIREAVLTTGLMPIIGEGYALSIALVLRLITTIGDIVLYLTSFLKQNLLCLNFRNGK